MVSDVVAAVIYVIVRAALTSLYSNKSSQMFRVVTRVRSIGRVAKNALRGGDHHGPALPPFARNAPPTSMVFLPTPE